MRRWLGADTERRRRLSPNADAGTVAALSGTAAPEQPEAEPDEEPAFRVWRPVWPVFELLLTAEFAVRYPPLGGPPIGLDWPQVQVVAVGLGVPWDRTAIELLRAAETEMVTIRFERWERARPKT